jgi:hypothetical protein
MLWRSRSHLYRVNVGCLDRLGCLLFASLATTTAPAISTAVTAVWN